MIRLSFIISILSLAVGCSTTDYSDQALRDRFIGKTKTELLSCAGVPRAQEDLSGKEVLTYEAESLFGYQGIVVTASCRFNFVVKSGEIESVQVNWSGPLIDQAMACGQIAQGCWEKEASPAPDQQYY